VAIDRHRRDDRRPYLFYTTDLGSTWKSLAANLPDEGPLLVVRADPRNRDLLYLGTQAGLFLSFDSGGTWLPFRAGLPPVPVCDLFLQQRDKQLVVATHGRGLFVMDVSPLEQFSPALAYEPAHLFSIEPVRAVAMAGYREPAKGRNFLAPNPPYGAIIHYSLGKRRRSNVRIAILDESGNEVAHVEGPGDTGLHRVVWDLQASPDSKQKSSPLRAGLYHARLVGWELPPQPFRVEVEQ
jgi:hypothetical protein